MTRCSIIIRSFNEERHIGRLLDGIERQELPNNVTTDVIVVDSGSTDLTVSIAKQMGARILHIAPDDFSFGRALNTGCQAATGDILIFASAHVYPVYTDWIEKMIGPFSNPTVGLVYGQQIGNEVTRFSEHEIFAKWFPSVSNYSQTTPFCNNANCAIRKSLWNEHRYDEYLTGLEDLEWANRIMKIGFKIVYQADAAIVHVHEETPQKIRNRYRREAIALKQIFPKIHFGFIDFIRLFVSNTFLDWLHAVKSNVFFREWKGIVVFRYMQFYGTYLGHNQKGEISAELKNKFYYPNVTGRPRGLKETRTQQRRKIEYS